MKYLIPFMIAVAIATTGCKKTSLSCTYVITPYLQEVSGGPEVIDIDAIGYLFYLDTAKYKIASYDDARNGIARDKASDSPVGYDIKWSTDDSGKLYFGTIGRMPVLITVADTVQKIYAWRQVPMADDIDYIYVPLHIRSWKTTYPYTDQKWEWYK